MRRKLLAGAMAVSGTLLCALGAARAQDKEKAPGKRIAIWAGRF